MIFEPAADGSAFIHRSPAASLLVEPDGVVFALAKPEKAARRSRRFRDLAFPHCPARSGLVLPGLFTRPGTAVDSQFRIENSKFTGPEPLTRAFVQLRPLRANPKARIAGLERLKSISNYFIGNDPKKWRTKVPNYAKVEIKDVYPGIDQVFYGNEGQLGYDFVVHPGADPGAIRLAVAPVGVYPGGAGDRRDRGTQSRATETSLQLDPQGDLVIPTRAGEVRFQKPVVYQQTPSPVSRNPDRGLSTLNSQLSTGSHILTASNEIRFSVGARAAMTHRRYSAGR